MAQQTIGIGSSANDGTGDPLRTAFNKCNLNFTELYSGSAFLATANVFTAIQTVQGATTTAPSWLAQVSGDSVARFRAGLNAADVPGIAGGSGSATRDAFFEYAGAANWRLGAADAASPVSQTLSVQNVVTGTLNTAGADLRINASKGTGTGASGRIILCVAAAGGSGSTPNALSDMYQFAGNGQLSIINNAGAIGIGSGSPDIWLRRISSSAFGITTTATGTTYSGLNAGIINACASTATPAAGSTSARLLFGTTAGFGIYYGSGAPTVSAAQGSIYLRSDGSGVSDRLYVNTNGSTGWTNFTSAA